MMLISFSVGNFRSYREPQTLSLLAGDGVEDESGTIGVDHPALGGRRILRTAVIYGANSSGKSNLIKAFDELATTVSRSARESTANDKLPFVQFGLDELSATLPSAFSVTFLSAGSLYNYEVNADRDRIHLEELTTFRGTESLSLFRRTVKDGGESEWLFADEGFRRDPELEQRTRPNSLYVSVGTQFNHDVLSDVSKFFMGVDIREPRFSNRELALSSREAVDDSGFREWASRLMTAADTGIVGIRASLVDHFAALSEDVRKTFPEEIRKQIEKGMREQPEVQVAHFGTDGRQYWWPIDRESDGTKQLFSLLRSWYAMIQQSDVVIVDELDDSLHPLISRNLIELTQKETVGAGTGQLIFTTHDTSLLDATLLRRDQVFFTEKDRGGATSLYSLLEYMPHQGENLQKGYLSGRFGAIPFLGDFNFAAAHERQADLKEVTTSAPNGRE